MLFTDVIRKKRDGEALSREDIGFFVSGLADGSLPAEQVSSLAMAIFLNSMSFEETAALTTAMANSGTVLDWTSLRLDGPVMDKHSTGGVGDKVSFLLAPIAAACGCYVPMISGRGLGHTGGTLDKIGSVPGYNAMPDFDLFRKVVRDTGCAIIGQTAELAPADRRLYAIRDITGTVESVALITASILSKKVAAGLDGLVIDAKAGTGAFMGSVPHARVLAENIIGTAKAAGLKTHALITDMNEVLGTTAGNAVEIAESVRYLRGDVREPRLDEVVKELSAEMLIAGGIESSRVEALATVEAAITGGAAAEVFARMLSALGGPDDFVSRYEEYLPTAPVIRPVDARQDGYLVEVNAFAIGNAIITLGGGRRKQDDRLDLSVGFTDVVPIGTRLAAGDPLALVHARSEADALEVSNLFRSACRIADSEPPERPVVHDRLEAS